MGDVHCTVDRLGVRATEGCLLIRHDVGAASANGVRHCHTTSTGCDLTVSNALMNAFAVIFAFLLLPTAL
eukprot:2717631-Prymnesium_polylepis.1